MDATSLRVLFHAIFLDKLFQNFCSYTLKTSQCNNVTNFPFYACNVTLVSTILRQQFFTHYFM